MGCRGSEFSYLEWAARSGCISEWRKGKINILKANPFYYSGIENRYRSLGEVLEKGWNPGKDTKPGRTLQQMKPAVRIDFYLLNTVSSLTNRQPAFPLHHASLLYRLITRTVICLPWEHLKDGRDVTGYFPNSKYVE